MNELFTLDIVTPDRRFFCGEVQAVVLQTPTGQREVLLHTLPCVFILSEGVMRIKQNDRWMEASAGTGFVRVGERDTVVMAQTCFWPYESAETDEDVVDDAVRDKKSLHEYNMAKAQLAIRMTKNKRDTRGDRM